MLNDLAHLFLALVWSEGGTRWSWGLRQWARLVGWLVGWSASLLSLSGRMKGAESTEGPGRKLMSHAV